MLSQLHWLQIEDKIRFKVLFLTFEALNDLEPSYLLELPLPLLPHKNSQISRSKSAKGPRPQRDKTGLNTGQGLLGYGPGLVERSAEPHQGPEGIEPVPQGL